MVYIDTIDIHSMIQHRLGRQQIKKGEDDGNQTEYQVASEVPKVGEMHQPPAEESQVSIDMINQAQAIPDYISEGLEPEYDVEEQWYHMHELDQLAIYEIQTSPEGQKAHPDYISAGTTTCNLPYSTRNNWGTCIQNAFMVLVRSKTMNIILF